MEEIPTIKPTRLNLDRVSLDRLNAILSTGSLDTLSEAERQYFYLMDIVRGLTAKMKFEKQNKYVTKAGIIKLLKSEQYGLSDWMARQVYTDAINFFYQRSEISAEAFCNLYAEKCEAWAEEMYASGDVKEARNLLKLAGEYRGCFKPKEADIPEELLNQKRVDIYTANREDLGLPAIDRKQLDAFIDSIPELSTTVRDNLKEDAGLKKFNLKKRMLYDIEELSEEDSGE